MRTRPVVHGYGGIEHTQEGPFDECLLCALADMRRALERIAEQQTKTIDWLRANGIVFDNLDDHWQKVAFSIYNDLCEVDTWAHDALGEGVDGKPRALAAAGPAPEETTP